MKMLGPMLSLASLFSERVSSSKWVAPCPANMFRAQYHVAPNVGAALLDFQCTQAPIVCRLNQCQNHTATAVCQTALPWLLQHRSARLLGTEITWAPASSARVEKQQGPPTGTQRPIGKISQIEDFAEKVIPKEKLPSFVKTGKEDSFLLISGQNALLFWLILYFSGMRCVRAGVGKHVSPELYHKHRWTTKKCNARAQLPICKSNISNMEVVWLAGQHESSQTLSN